MQHFTPEAVLVLITKGLAILEVYRHDGTPGDQHVFHTATTEPTSWIQLVSVASAVTTASSLTRRNSGPMDSAITGACDSM